MLQILCSVTDPKLTINASALVLWVSTCLCPCLLRACPCLPSCLLKRHSTQQRHRASPSTHASVRRHRAFSPCTCGIKREAFLDPGKARGWPHLDEKKSDSYSFAWNLARSFKVSFKHRTLRCASLELPKLLMDSEGLNPARKDVPRQQKAQNHVLGEGSHHQQHPYAAPRSSSGCFLLLKGFFVSQGWVSDNCCIPCWWTQGLKPAFRTWSFPEQR